MNDEYDNFTMLKYEPGDFFLNHRDTDMSAYEDGNHLYTCLIFCPFSENNELLEGGELIFKHPDGLYDIKFDPAVETRQNRFVMVIFSIDMYHEVLPIIKGSRWVFKKPLFVKTFSKYKTEKKEDIDDDYHYENLILPYYQFLHLLTFKTPILNVKKLNNNNECNNLQIFLSITNIT